MIEALIVIAAVVLGGATGYLLAARDIRRNW